MKLKRVVALACMLVALGTSVLAASFSDLEGHWASENITKLVDAGVVNGYPDGTYKPEATISRGEFLKLIIEASMPEGVTVEEAPMAIDHWAGRHLFIAQMYTIVDPGAITLENINEPITRREMVLMLSKADTILRQRELNQTESVTFNDYDEMNAAEIRFLTHAISEKYINGYPEDNTFKPDNNMTRAEAATVIFRYLNKAGELGGGEEVSEE